MFGAGKVVARLFGLGRADPVACAAGNAEVGDDHSRAVFNLDGFDRAAADAFIAILAVVFYLLYRARKSKYTMAVLGVCTVVLASSIWINPVAKGVPEITKSETMQQIRDLVKEDPQAIWLVVDMAYPATNIPAMAGADCLNTTQTYPQKTRWETLDQEGEYEDIYNRYCHIRASLGSKTMLELVSTDYVEVTLSPEELKKLNIT